MALQRTFYECGRAHGALIGQDLGGGEPARPQAIPAVTDAIYDATGTRVRDAAADPGGSELVIRQGAFGCVGVVAPVATTPPGPLRVSSLP